MIQCPEMEHSAVMFSLCMGLDLVFGYLQKCCLFPVNVPDRDTWELFAALNPVWLVSPWVPLTFLTAHLQCEVVFRIYIFFTSKSVTLWFVDCKVSSKTHSVSVSYTSLFFHNGLHAVSLCTILLPKSHI